MNNKLSWHEKLPLALLMAAQALVIFRWYTFGALPMAVVGMLPYATTLVGIAAALALDVAVVTTAMARRAGRRSIWGALTTASAMAFSSLVALDVYDVFPFGAWLHAAFPVVTFFYAQHLAASMPAKHSEQEYEDALLAMGAKLDEMGSMLGHVAANGGHSSSNVSASTDGHKCPSCGTLLTAGQYGAAARYGYCSACKPSSKNGHKAEDIQEMEAIV
jgi:hypothetical protein